MFVSHLGLSAAGLKASRSRVASRAMSAGNLTVMIEKPFQVVMPATHDDKAKPFYCILMGVADGCTCGILEFYDGKKKTKGKLPRLKLRMQNCMAVDIGKTPFKKMDCVTLTFSDKGTFMLLADAPICRLWADELEKQWKGDVGCLVCPVAPRRHVLPYAPGLRPHAPECAASVPLLRCRCLVNIVVVSLTRFLSADAFLCRHIFLLTRCLFADGNGRW